MFTIELDETGYQLVAGTGEESGVTDYGEPAEIEVDGKTYVATVESREAALADPPEVYLCLDEVPAVEEVEFDLTETDEDDDEDDEDADEDDDGGEIIPV